MPRPIQIEYGNIYYNVMNQETGWRAMRHINGIYTQRYNRLRKIDGPLFRGKIQSNIGWSG